MRMKHIRKISILLAVILTVTAIPMSAGAETSSTASLEGTYILYNSYANSYAGSASTTPSQGTNVQHQYYANNNTQKWIVTQVPGTDRYWITMNDYCLATASTGTDVYLQINYGTSATYQQWYIEPMEVIDGRFGRYVIRTANTNNANKVLMVDGTTMYTQLEIGSYSVNNNFQTEWYLCPIDECVVYLHPKYDAGYQTRYSTAYASRINGYMEALQRTYITQFGIWIIYDSPSSAVTYFDQCDAAYDELCTCVADSACANSDNSSISTYHHTNIHNVLRQLPKPHSYQHRYAYFLGHKYCSQGNHPDQATHGLCDTHVNACIAYQSSTLGERKTTVHEFGHFFAAIDHYDSYVNNSGLSQQGYSDYCIYGVYINDSTVINNLLICDGCKEDILAKRTIYVNAMP